MDLKDANETLDKFTSKSPAKMLIQVLIIVTIANWAVMYVFWNQHLKDDKAKEDTCNAHLNKVTDERDSFKNLAKECWNGRIERAEKAVDWHRDHQKEE